MSGQKDACIMGPPLPMVTLCTPTFNRRPFFEAAMRCVAAQTYPRERMEWLVVDDGTDPVGDLFAEGAYNAAALPRVRYEYAGPEKLPLGAKRNLVNALARGDILVYWDDDDYYPPTRVAHAVDMLLNNREYRIAGAKAIHMYFADSCEVYRYGPYSKRPEQASAATFAFWRTYPGRFDPLAALAEEESFTRNYTEPMLALDPMQTILAMAHDHNSYDKRWARDAQSFGGTFAKCADLGLADFVRAGNEEEELLLCKFYADTMPCLLRAYAATASVVNKPDVVEMLQALDQVTPELAAELLAAENPPPQIEEEEEEEMLQQQHNNLLTPTTSTPSPMVEAASAPSLETVPEAYTMSVVTANGSRRDLSATEAVQLVRSAQNKYLFAEKERAATAAERDAMADQVESLKQECARLRAALTTAAGGVSSSSSSSSSNKRKYRVEDYERCIAELVVAAAVGSSNSASL